MNADDVLKQAIETIERDGWYQGGYYQMPSIPPPGSGSNITDAIREARKTAPVCSMGAINRVMTSDAANGFIAGDQGDVYEDVKRRLAAAIGYPGLLSGRDEFNWIVDYNDLKSTTKEDVVLAFKKAAARD